MKLKLPKVTPKGSALIQSEIIAKNGKEEETIKVNSRNSVFPHDTGPASVGVSLGLTIPGPPRSYMAARVDISVVLPCGVTKEELVAAKARASALVNQFIAEEAKDIRSYFSDS